MLNFESSKTKFITWLLFLSLFAILSEASWFNTATCICSQNVKNTHPSITQTKTQIVDPYPKIRKQSPRKFPGIFYQKIKKSLSPYLFIHFSCFFFHVTQLREARKMDENRFYAWYYFVQCQSGGRARILMYTDVCHWSSSENPRSNKQTYNFNTTVLSIKRVCY